MTEQRYQAVLAVIGEGRTVSEVALQWRVDRRTAAGPAYAAGGHCDPDCRDRHPGIREQPRIKKAPILNFQDRRVNRLRTVLEIDTGAQLDLPCTERPEGIGA